ncbi:tRNA pseudouridine(55) synthase TruB [bacterium]|nr:tRNA pseudouridine(55) synthase TruB [bacterium]
MTSFQITDYIKKRTGYRKVGHLGTLDPQAEGLLPILLGDATKLVPFLIEQDKEYIGTMVLGEERDTMDREGKVIQRYPLKSLKQQEIDDIISSFHGPIEQAPPIYSAVKVNGQPSYKLVRKGLSPRLSPRTVVIKELYADRATDRTIDFKVVCSKGTYVRSLVSDIGKKLGMGAYLDRLVRTRNGKFSLDQSINLKELEEFLEKQDLESLIISIEDALAFLPSLTLKDEYSPLVMNGIPCKTFFFMEEIHFPPGQVVLLKSSGGYVQAVVKSIQTDLENGSESQSFEYIRVFHPQSVQV